MFGKSSWLQAKCHSVMEPQVPSWSSSRTPSSGRVSSRTTSHSWSSSITTQDTKDLSILEVWRWAKSWTIFEIGPVMSDNMMERIRWDGSFGVWWVCLKYASRLVLDYTYKQPVHILDIWIHTLLLSGNSPDTFSEVWQHFKIWHYCGLQLTQKEKGGYYLLCYSYIICILFNMLVINHSNITYDINNIQHIFSMYAMMNWFPN